MDVPYRNRSVVFMRIFPRVVKFSTTLCDNMPAGITNRVCSRVRRRTDLNVMSSTAPKCSEMRHMSPTASALSDKQKQSANQILDGLLGAEGNRNAGNSQPCQNGAGIDADQCENRKYRRRDDQGLDHAFAQQQQRPGAGVFPGLHLAVDVVEEVNQPDGVSTTQVQRSKEPPPCGHRESEISVKTRARITTRGE